LAVVEDAGLKRLYEDRFLNEEALEALLEANPDLIALDEVDPSATSLVPIGRQVTLAGQALDLLFIDLSGKLTAVEAKLERNVEIRRQVVAQVLEYGAYLSEWDVETLEIQAKRYFSDPKAPASLRGLTLYEAVSRTAMSGLGQDEGTDEEQFRARIAQNLNGSSLRLVIAVDRIVDPLRRLVAFLNSTSTFELYLLEVQQYRADGGLHLASINLFGQKPGPRSGTSARSAWDEARFLETLQDQAGGASEIAKALYSFIQDEAETTVWGTGTVEGSAGYGIRVGGVRLVLFYITTRCRVWISMGPLNKALDEGIRASFLTTLRSLGVSASGDYLAGERSLNFDVELLGRAGTLDSFKAAVRDLERAADPSVLPS